MKPWELRGRGGGVGRRDGQSTPRPRSGGPSPPPVVPPRPTNTVGRCKHMQHLPIFGCVQGICWDLQLIESSVTVCTQLETKYFEKATYEPIGLRGRPVGCWCVSNA